MSDIDSLVIDINAKSQRANDAIDRLVGKLDRLSTSLTKINGTNLSGLANGVQKLGTAMQTMNNVKTADFTRLATNLTKLGNVNTQALNTMASSMSHLTRAFNNLGTVSSNAQQVGELANNLSQLGSARMQRAIVSIPQLATAMSNLMATLSTAPRVSRNVIDMANAMANLSAQGSHVGTASRHMVSGLNRTSTSANRASKSYKGLASSIGKFYATYFAVIRGLKGLWQSIESTADYIEAYNYFNVALGKIGSDWSEQFEQYGYENAEAYAESFSKRLSEGLRDLSGVEIQIGADGKGILSATGMKNLGLNIQEVTQYASQLASVTNSVGQTGEVSLAAAESLTKLGADISSLFNIDFSQAMTNLQSGLIGQSRALYKYGIDITNATLQTYAYELGIEKAVSEMTQAEKMQLRMIAILDQSKVAWGDLANTISSPSNMMRQFTNNLKETGIVLGQLFVPLLQKVLPVINGATIAIKRLLVNIAGFLGIKLDLDSFGQGYNSMGEDIDGATDSLDDLTEASKKAKGALRGFDELKVINTSDSNAIKGMEDTLDLTDEILAATSEYEKVWDEAFDKMENKAEQFADKFELFFEPFAKLFESIMNFNSPAWEGFAGFFDNLGDIAWPVIKGGLGAISDFIDDIPPSVAQNIGQGFGALATALVTIAGLSGISHILGGIVSAITSHPIIAALGLLTGSVLFFATEIEEIENAEEIEVFGDTLENINTNAELFGEKISDAINTIHNTIENAGEADIAYIEDLWEEYQNLAGQTELSADEVTRLKTVSETLEDYIPGFKKVIEDETKTWGEQVTAIEELIAQKEKMYKLDAAKRMITTSYQTLIEAEKAYSEASELLEPIEDARNQAWDDYYNARKELARLEEELGYTYEDATRGAGGARKYGAESDPLVKQHLYVNKLKSEYEDLEKQVNALSPSFKQYQDALADAQADVDWIYNYIAELEGASVTSAEKTVEITNDATKSIEEMSTSATGAINGIEEEASKSANETTKHFEDMVKAIGTKVTELSKIKIDIPISFSGIGSLINKIFDFNVPKYAVGGFPEDGLFFANHSELVGRFANGKTAVANNEQIISGIANGVRSANAEQNALLQEQNALLRQILQKETGISANEIFESVRNSASNFYSRTGNPAFDY